MIPYLYKLIHNQAFCLVQPKKLWGTAPIHESAFAVPSRRRRLVRA